MKTYNIVDPLRMQPPGFREAKLFEIEADFLYAQPSGTTTLHRFRPNRNDKSDIVAVVPANLLILEV